jgi:hypothetical protein
VIKDVSASYDALIEIFQIMSSFLERLVIYTELPLAKFKALSEIIVKILAKFISILAVATNAIQQGRLSESILRLHSHL